MRMHLVLASMTKIAFSLALAFAVFSSNATAQQWAVDMFETTDHDFGTVARGAKAEFEFVFNNIYLEDAHVASVRSSCGCTTPTIKTTGMIKTYQQGVITAKVNTGSFLGSKGATVTVTFDKPQYAEVQLHVHSYIRDDVVFEPGSVSFGTVDAGKPQEQSVTVDYSGNSGWRIQEVKSNNPHITAGFIETGRGGGRVSYKLIVKLDKDTPVGYLNDHLVLVTNEQGSQQVPLQIEGRVNAGITVSPGTLFLGVLEPGQKVEKKLVIRGKKPFKIVSINCPGGDVTYDRKALDESKAVHVVPITFTAGSDHGKVSRTIQIETDLGTATQKLPAYAVVE